MNEYTPTVEQVRSEYADSRQLRFLDYANHAAEFDRWLASHDAELLATVAGKASNNNLGLLLDAAGTVWESGEGVDAVSGAPKKVWRPIGGTDSASAIPVEPTHALSTVTSLSATGDEREALAELIQEGFPTGGGGYSVIYEDCLPIADTILTRFTVTPKNGDN